MIRNLSRLFRLPLALMNGIAAMGGYCLFPTPRSVYTMLIGCAGVALLAMGGAALNQVLERDIDALMQRTSHRPLPQGVMTPFSATFIGCGVILSGCIVLLIAGNFISVMLGMGALIWYLAVYTPLKRLTPLALLLGALCGAVPPLIGWSLAGGELADFRITTLAGMFFIWQIPHFWLLQNRYACDYRQAGIQLFTFRQDLFWLWLVALSAMTLLLPAFRVIGHYEAYGFCFFAFLLIVMARFRSERSFYSFMNLFPVLVTLTLLIQR